MRKALVFILPLALWATRADSWAMVPPGVTLLHG